MADMILEQVRDALRTANIIATDREYCELWLGKSECYLRSLRFNDISPSADALANCAARLAWTANALRARDAVAHAHWADVLDDLRVRCYHAMDQQAQSKWQRKGVSA